MKNKNNEMPLLPVWFSIIIMVTFIILTGYLLID